MTIRILQYLADAYEGSCSELESAIAGGKNFEIDIWKINRKAAGSAIVYRAGCDGADGSFADYISAGGSPELEEGILVPPRLCKCDLKQPIHRYMVQMILRLCRWGAKVSRLCKNCGAAVLRQKQKAC